MGLGSEQHGQAVCADCGLREPKFRDGSPPYGWGWVWVRVLVPGAQIDATKGKLVCPTCIAEHLG